MTRFLQALWKSMSDGDKETYCEEAEEDKERFESEMKEFDAGKIFEKDKKK